METTAKRTLLFLVRHGETEWNSQRRFQGQTEIALNEKGRAQSRRTAQRLEGINLQAAYSSDLSRARECAEIIAAPHGLEVKALPALRERNFGALEGMTGEEGRQHPWWKALEESDGFLAAPGGETRAESRRRVVECVNEIIAAHEGQQVLIVSHGGPISQIVCDLLGAPPERRARMRLDNCSLTIVEIAEQKRTVLLMNDVSHLFPAAPIGVLAAMEDKAWE